MSEELSRYFIEIYLRGFAKDYIRNLSAKYNQQFSYIETSALTGVKIEAAFELLVQEILNFQTE